MKNVLIKLLNDKASVPQKAATDACYDAIATSKEDLGDGRIRYGLGFALELPKNTQMDLRARSSIHKTGLIVSNGVGTCDEDYRGEYMVVFYHVIPTLPPYEIGDKIIQIQLKSREDVKFMEAWELKETERGAGGYGSTDLPKSLTEIIK